jgi:structural maintenance of chromosome 2
MHIKEIILDGFKSYPNRTVVSGFDPAFNAITGLNGSGKSNILDSICFVLGITNLSQVRVGNLQELVYKQGQAGVTKASVTIVFDNRDTKGSPVGYEQHQEISVCRQIVINGKNKYMINGHTAQQEQVKNLFHSVQLNVNNPHFLIMQGRITKVLNMNPMEILSMIEEAAGTRMFETKKQAALKTMERKQEKNDAIDRVLTEEITPTLDKLRTEKGNYVTFMANETKIERSERFCVAYEYKKAVTKLEEAEDELATMTATINEMGTRAQELAAEIKAKEEETKALGKKRGGDMSKAYEKSKSIEEALSKDLVRLTTVWKNKEDAVKKEEKSLAAAQEAREQGAAAVDAKKTAVAETEADLAAAKAAVASATAAFADVEKSYQNMCAGISAEEADNDDSGTLTDQLSRAHEAASKADEAVKQGNMTAKHLGESVKGLKKELKAVDKDSEALASELKVAEAALTKLNAKLSAAQFDPVEQKALVAEKGELESSLGDLREVSERLEAELSGRLAFEFKAPSKTFDRSKVKGLVARLVTVSDRASATALEVVAGGKLYNVVVDNEVTAKEVLQKGALKRRVTFVPLNKISRNGMIGDDKVAAAASIAAKKGGTAVRALELVGFDEEVRAAMEYAFGDKLVCDTLDTARAVANNPAVNRKCVTLSGDVVDPSGTMTGGSSGGLGTCLAKLTELTAAKVKLEAATARFAEVDVALKALAKGAAAHGKDSEAAELKAEEVALMKERLGRTAGAALEAKLAEAERELAAAEAKAKDAKASGEAARQRVKDLGAQEASLRKKREERLKDLESAVKAAKKTLKDAESKASACEKKLKLGNLELEKMVDEVSSGDGSVAALEEELTNLKAAVEVHQTAAVNKRSEYDTAKQALVEASEELAACDAEVKAVTKAKEKATKALAEAQLEAKKMENNVSRFNKEQGEARKFVDAMTAKHAWIAGEAKYFGVARTDYDFESRDPEAAAKELKELQRQQESLSKKINKKVMNMLDKAEVEYTDLMAKRKVIEADKSKIEKVIAELDVKKNQALQTTWIKVNRDFGSIFSTLLPGTHAKLEPPESGSGSVLDGLEVKVAFGSVWKESLSELSGGQRSLLALSLILALLLFKPAPMYILDEVDAALDLSHTQNIGAMLRTHFSNSQFIVVSLKEGMFNNANCIFRTKFVDGSSTVTRTANEAAVAILKAQDKARAAAKSTGAENDGAIKGPAKKRGKAASDENSAAGNAAEVV